MLVFNVLQIISLFSYMAKQRDINHAMRTILIDWMVEVSEEMKLTTETLCIAVNITDRWENVIGLSFVSNLPHFTTFSFPF